MEDDIDIEEHDVLDNPVIKSVFPDISVIKKEITKYFEEEPAEEEDSEPQETKPQTDNLQLNVGEAYLQTYASQTHYTAIAKDTNTVNNVCQPIILSNKIILGSKPYIPTKNDALKLDSKRVKDVKVQFKEMKIILQDIKSYLDQNGRYCKECCTLFLSKNNLAAHRSKVHDNEISKDSMRLTNTNIIGNKHKRQTCNTYFALSSSLKRHCYKIHRKRTNPSINDNLSSLQSQPKRNIVYPSTCKENQFHTNSERQKFTSKETKLTKNSNRSVHSKSRKGATAKKKHEPAAAKLKTDKAHKIDSAKKKKTSETQYLSSSKTIKKKQAFRKQIAEKNRHKCNICGYAFTCSSNLSRHYKNIHKKLIKLRLRGCNTSKIKAGPQELGKIDTKNSFKDNAKNNKKITSIKKRRMSANDGDDKHKKLKAEEKQVAPDKEIHTLKYVTRSRNFVSKDSNFCLHCNKTFSDQKSLTKHMNEILEPKRSSNEVTKYDEVEKKTDKTMKDNKDIFTCRHCSYYLPTIKAYFVHMIKNHKIEVFLEVHKEKFEVLCKYCPTMCKDVRIHNQHVHRCHRRLMTGKIMNEKLKQIDNEIRNSESMYENIFSEYQTFALESVLFECNKCSICFLSSSIARDHNQHMDLLVNWKCSICNQIMKNHDREMHLKQHSFSAPIKVLKLNEFEIDNVLYNCTKCTIHFTEKRYQEHYQKCEIKPADSSYCKICDILVDKTEMILHETKHNNSIDLSDFTIIESNMIVNIEDCEPSRKRTSTNNESEGMSRKRLYQQYNCYTYCNTCKCFLTDNGLSNKAHVNGACSHIQKSVCYQCGLILTTRSMMTAHRPKHRKDKNLRLQDFKFLDLKGKQIIPPIPEYPHCEECGIHFLTKRAINRHMCDETDFLTCDVCNIKLSETAFKLHMSFHFYFIQKIPNLPNLISNSDGSNKTEYQKAEVLTKTTNKQYEDQLELQKSKNTTDSVKRDSNTSNLNIDTASQNQKTDESNEQMSELGESLLVLYDCKQCSIAEASYDEVIEHCRSHYNAIDKNKSPEKVHCTKCSLTFDSLTLIDHQKTFHSRETKMKVIKFDPNYFKCENKTWVKHLFESLPENMMKKLVDESIYRQEHRIKLNWVQKSLSGLNLNVYKCGICGNIIEADCVYKHAEKPCAKVRKHPCAICGLPFISMKSRYNHEKLHKTKTVHNLKDLNIISFNESRDKIYNQSIFRTNDQYILYQCRNCDRVTEKSQLTKHVCDRNTLRKCLSCGLLFSRKDYKTHVSKHTDIGNYCASNFKVILFGRINNIDDTNESIKLSSSFSGTVYDYTLYKCENCKICLKNFENSKKHICALNFDLDRTMCSECDLYFPSSYLKYHLKQHSSDPEFIKENMNIITFNPNRYEQSMPLKHEKIQNCAEKICTNEIEKNAMKDREINIYSNKENDVISRKKNCANDTTDNNVNDGKEQNVNKKIIDIEKLTDDRKGKNEFHDYAYKNKEINEKRKRNTNDNDVNFSMTECADNGKINNHSTMIVDSGTIEKSMESDKGYIVDGVNESIDAEKDDNDSRVSNEGDLYDNNKSNAGDRIENINNQQISLYKCKCGLHFENKPKVIEHFKNCHPKAKQCKQNCSKCHLLFNPSELFSHLLVHHKNKTQVDTFHIIDISAIDE